MNTNSIIPCFEYVVVIVVGHQFDIDKLSGEEREIMRIPITCGKLYLHVLKSKNYTNLILLII